MRKLNFVFLIGLLAILAIFGAGTHFLHAYQVHGNATALLDRAERAAADNDLEMAEQSLRQYLSLRREDGPAWKRFAQIVEQRDRDRRRREQVFLAHEQALRYNAGDLQLERRCADLALELRRYSDAKRHLANLLNEVLKDSQGQPPAAAVAELEDSMGRCDRGLTRYEEAEEWFGKAIEHAPGRLSCYEMLARLRRNELRRIESADRTIKEMVVKNPKAGRAYLFRWRYSRDYSPSPEPGDLQKALELAPDDPEVLLAGAIASEQKQDLSSARAYFEKGRKLDPKNEALALGLAALETREQHLDQAESILRQTIRLNPSNEMDFRLAENLIMQDKIDGKDQAADYIARLRQAGLGDTVVLYLEARIPFQHRNWPEAIRRIEMARPVLQADRQLTAQLDLMLVECYGRTGDQERRLEALKRVAESDRASDFVRIEFAESLARAGKLDQGIAILMPLSVEKPALKLDLVRFLIQKNSRRPRDQRNWAKVEEQLRDAEKALPQGAEPLLLLRVELLAEQERIADALALLESAHAKDPRNLRYRLGLARLTQRKGASAAALQILDQAEKALGPSFALQQARLDYWAIEGGAAAKAAVAKLAEMRRQISEADRPAFLERLATVEMRLGDSSLARQYWAELAALQPHNVRVLLALFNLAMEAADHAYALNLVSSMREAEGENGTFWRFAQATLLIDQARRGENKDRNLSRSDDDAVRALASEIAKQRPDWWGGPLILAEIAELEGRYDDVIEAYSRSIDLGNTQPAILRHVLGLLSERRRFADIDRLVKNLRDRGIAAEDFAIATAFDAIRKKDYERGLALARKVIPANSAGYSDHLALGRILMTSRKVEEAGKEFRQAVKLAPSVPVTWLSWVQYLARTNQAQSAREAAAAAEKALSPVGSARILAQCYWFAGEASKAESLFRTAMKDRPHDAPTLRLAANFFLDQNRLDRAAALVAELLKPETKGSQADVAWAKRSEMMMRFANGVKPEQVDQALKLFEQDLEFDPDDFDALRMHAVLLSMRYTRRKDSIQALESIDRATWIAPRERFLLATLYWAEGDLAKCRSEMRKVLEDDPRQPRYLVFYITLMTRLGELDEGEKWLRALKTLIPVDQAAVALELDAMILKARKQDREIAMLIRRHVEQNPSQAGAGAFLFERYGFLKEAEQAYRTDLARNPGKPASVSALVEFLARRDRPGEALELCEKAMGTWHREAVILASVTSCLAKSVTEAQLKKVEDWLREILRQKPDDLSCNLRLGTLCTVRGNYSEAEAIYRRLLRTNSDNVEALNNLAWQLALRDKDCEEALKLVERAIEIAGPKPGLLGTRAVVLMQLSQGAKAIEVLHRAVSSDPERPIHYFHLARAYHMTNADAEARKALDQSNVLGLSEETVDPLERGAYRTLRQDIALH